MDSDYLFMSDAEREAVREQAKKLNDAIRRGYRAQFMRDPMAFIRDMSNRGYTDKMLNEIINDILKL